tara:strand:- start:200 stop:532 length:333 start_codon:yes stop_codon:yes gene_type:complete
MKTKKRNNSKNKKGGMKTKFVDIHTPGFSKTRQITNPRELKDYNNYIKRIGKEKKLNKRTLKQRLFNFFKRKKRPKTKKSSIRPRLPQMDDIYTDNKLKSLGNQNMADSI